MLITRFAEPYTGLVSRSLAAPGHSRGLVGARIFMS